MAPPLDVSKVFADAIRMLEYSMSDLGENCADDMLRARPIIEGLVTASKQVLALYPLHWDRVDGAAIIMPDRVQQFDDAFAALYQALNQIGDVK